MALLRSSRSVLLLTCATTGCTVAGGAPSSPKPTQARKEPRVLRLEPAATCDKGTLESFAPSHAALRTAAFTQSKQRRAWPIATEICSCGSLPATKCLEWAQARARQAKTGVSAAASPYLKELGSDVSLSVDGEKVERVFATTGHLLTFIDERERRGKSVTITNESRAFRYDWSRVEIKYVQAQESERLQWTRAVDIRLPEGRRAQWEALRSFSDELAAAGLELDEASNRAYFEAALQQLRPEEWDTTELGSVQRQNGLAWVALMIGLMRRIPRKDDAPKLAAISLRLNLVCAQP